jgi:hypothetical protein
VLYMRRVLRILGIKDSASSRNIGRRPHGRADS